MSKTNPPPIYLETADGKGWRNVVIKTKRGTTINLQEFVRNISEEIISATTDKSATVNTHLLKTVPLVMQITNILLTDAVGSETAEMLLQTSTGKLMCLACAVSHAAANLLIESGATVEARDEEFSEEYLTKKEQGDMTVKAIEEIASTSTSSKDFFERLVSNGILNEEDLTQKLKDAGMPEDEIKKILTKHRRLSN